MVLELLLTAFLILEVLAATCIIIFVIYLWHQFLKIVEEWGYKFYIRRHPEEHKGQ